MRRTTRKTKPASNVLRFPHRSTGPGVILPKGTSTEGFKGYTVTGDSLFHIGICHNDIAIAQTIFSPQDIGPRDFCIVHIKPRDMTVGRLVKIENGKMVLRTSVFSIEQEIYDPGDVDILGIVRYIQRSIENTLDGPILKQFAHV